jgi:hypothetical protein
MAGIMGALKTSGQPKSRLLLRIILLSSWVAVATIFCHIVTHTRCHTVCHTGANTPTKKVRALFEVAFWFHQGAPRVLQAPRIHFFSFPT